MKFALPAGLLEATQLTRAGRLIEATAAIQRALGRPSASEAVDQDDSIIEGIFSKVENTGQVQDLPPVAQPQPRRRKEQSGDFIEGSHTCRAGARSYKLYVPSGHTGEARAMVVMLHGCTQTPDDFAAGTRMNLLAGEGKFIVLYPAQAPRANRSRCWNWFMPGDQCRGKGEPAIIAGMTRELASRYGVDASKVYVAGLSAGGAMAAVMGATYPDIYAAVGIHSGLPAGSAHDVRSAFAVMRGTQSPLDRTSSQSSHAVPVIVFHGDRDTTVHPRNGEPHSASGNSVSVEHGQVPGGHAYTRTIHTDPGGRVVLEHWLVHGAGHAWSGGSSYGTYTDPSGPDATRAMLRFFLHRPR